MLAGLQLTWKAIQKSTAFEKRTVVNIWPMQHGWQAHTRGEQEDSAHSTIGDTVVANIHSIPRGKEKTKRNPTTRWEVLRSSSRWAGSLRQRGHTRIHSMGCSRLCSVKGDSARGTEHYECQGHWTLWVPGALNITSARGTEHLKVPRTHWTLVATRANVWIRSGESSYTFSLWSLLQIRVGASLSILKYCYLRLPH